MIFLFFSFVFAVLWKKKKNPNQFTMSVSGKENTFTCCKNTFPNFNINTQSLLNIHSFLVRWLDVSAKTKTEEEKKKSPDLCTKGRGRGPENARDCSSLWGQKTWGTRNMRQRATAGGYVCIWTLREKKWPILCYFPQTTPVSAMPSPPSPTEAPAAL